MNTIPLLGGDVLIDTAMGFSIGSADQLAVILAHDFEAKRLIFATDVGGIYASDPKTNPDASIIGEINLSNLDSALKQMGVSSIEDASGAMKGKLSSVGLAMDLIEEGLETTLLSMMEYGNLMAHLKGQEIDCTRIVSK